MRGLFRLGLLTLVVALSTLTARAELVSFGLSGGVNRSNYTIDGFDGDVSNNTGYQFGATATIGLAILSVSPEVWYSQSNFELSNSMVIDDCKVRSRSVDMPILVGLSLFDLIKLEAGPSFSLYSNAKADFGRGASPSEYDFGRVHSTVGYAAGAKLMLGKVVIGARYNGQFGGYKNKFGGNNNMRIKHNSYSLSFGYKL